MKGGHFELGIGAGWLWGPIGAMGGDVRPGRAAVDALEETIEVARRVWSGERSASMAIWPRSSCFSKVGVFGV